MLPMSPDGTTQTLQQQQFITSQDEAKQVAAALLAVAPRGNIRCADFFARDVCRLHAYSPRSLPTRCLAVVDCRPRIPAGALAIEKLAPTAT